MSTSHGGAGYEAKTLMALRDRVIKESGFSVGAKARLKQTIPVDKNSGWWPFAPTLHGGATGRISKISFSSKTGAMLIYWVPDLEWCRAYFYPRTILIGKGKEHFTLRKSVHSYVLRAEELEPCPDG